MSAPAPETGNKRLREVAIDFLAKPLPNTKLLPGVVPGIDRDLIHKLRVGQSLTGDVTPIQAIDIDTVSELVGQFFLHQRDEAAFVRFLEQVT